MSCVIGFRSYLTHLFVSCLIIGMELTVGNVNDVPRKMDHNICGWHSSSNFGFRMLNFTNFTSKGRLKSGVMIHRGILSVLVFVVILVKILL